MDYVILKDTEEVKIKKYIWKTRRLYFLYLYDKKKYESYKSHIYKYWWVIKSVWLYENCIRFVYYLWYDPSRKPLYYIKNNLVWIKQAIKSWLI